MKKTKLKTKLASVTASKASAKASRKEKTVSGSANNNSQVGQDKLVKQVSACLTKVTKNEYELLLNA